MGHPEAFPPSISAGVDVVGKAPRCSGAFRKELRSRRGGIMPRSAQNGSPWEQRARLPACWPGRPLRVREMADQELVKKIEAV